MKKVILLTLGAFLAFSCQDDAISVAEVIDEELDHTIAGTWLHVEYGYSPGDKYHQVPVPTNPPKTITFKGDFTMSSAIMGMDIYKYYRLLEDPVANRQVIALFEEDPGNEPLDLASLTTTYFTHWQGNYLNLNYRWCFEGCHLKFKRISSVDTE